jgi:hypothetical protein
LHRTVVFARRIGRDQGSPQVPRGMTIPSDGVMNRINTIRNAIEHIEEKIARGEVVDGDTIAPTVKSDSIEFRGGRNLLYGTCRLDPRARLLRRAVISIFFSIVNIRRLGLNIALELRPIGATACLVFR